MRLGSDRSIFQAMNTTDLLKESYPLAPDAARFYRENGFIKLKNVLSADVLGHFDRLISDQVLQLSTQRVPMEERSTYGKAFLQVMNLWTQDEAVRELVLSPRLARIAAMLMEVDGVRLYHDQALYKEAGGGYTPWHADQYYWPLATPKCITAWIPLQETPLEMGALEFSARSHLLKIGRDQPISDDSEALIEQALADSTCEQIIEPYEFSEVSFHAGWCFHRAAPNTTNTPRQVMCIIYMDSMMRLKEPENTNQRLDRDTWCPGAKVGEVIDTPLNPVIWSK